MTIKQISIEKIKAVGKLISRITVVLFVGYTFNVISDILHSDITVTGETVLYESEKGVTTIGKISGGVKKSPPKQKKRLNMIDLKLDTTGNKEVGFKRRVIKVWGLDVYVGPSVFTDKKGSLGAGLGISVTF